MQPGGALLVGSDGSTLYGTTVFGGVNGGGTAFALKGTKLTILHDFDNYESSAAGTYSEPQGALIFGADGKLYGVTYSGGTGSCIYSLNTDGTDFSALHVFTYASNAPGTPVAGLVLARNGLMYGTTLSGSIEMGDGQDNGVVYSFNPANGTFTALADFNGTVGAAARAALIEAADDTLYTTASLYGGGNKRGTDAGTVVRLTPALKE